MNAPTRPAPPVRPDLVDRDPYRHLEEREQVIWGLSFGQLLYVLVGVAAAVVFALYVSPLAIGPTLTLAIFAAGLPVVASQIASSGDIAPWTMTLAIWRWASTPRHYLPGASTCAGYHVHVDDGPGPRALDGADRDSPSLAQVLDL